MRLCIYSRSVMKTLTLMHRTSPSTASALVIHTYNSLHYPSPSSKSTAEYYVIIFDVHTPLFRSSSRLWRPTSWVGLYWRCTNNLWIFVNIKHPSIHPFTHFNIYDPTELCIHSEPMTNTRTPTHAPLLPLVTLELYIHTTRCTITGIHGWLLHYISWSPSYLHSLH